jgi:DNA repair protein RadA/Sms
VADLTEDDTPRLPTGLPEFDRVVGGGLVSGQVVLLAGEPGVGKSTLALTVAHEMAARSGKPVLYVSGEESAAQIGVRARRIGAVHPRLLIADENDLRVLVGHVEQVNPALLVVDSVQTLASADVDGRAGGVSQVLEVTQALTRMAKGRGLPVIAIGQSTRENSVAGPRAMEHLVDTVLTFDGDPQTSLRLLRAAKNRYGSAEEVACFEQSDDGLREVVDPSHLFRSRRDTPVPGTCVTVSVTGRRPLVVEVQSLVAPTASPAPRRSVTGMDSSRVTMLIAVAERAGMLRLRDQDVFAATVGGARIADPGADLAICLAVASAATSMPVDVLAIGEVALSGDIRPVPSIAARVAEAARLGHARIIVPAGSGELLGPAAPEVIEVSRLDDLLEALGCVRRSARSS